jgi:hypothetical protein
MFAFSHDGPISKMAAFSKNRNVTRLLMMDEVDVEG